MTKHIIWSNRDLNINDWKEDILEVEPSLDERQVSLRVSDINSELLNDIRDNLEYTVYAAYYHYWRPRFMEW